MHIWAGSEGYTGAPYFAAQAAVKTGAGLVFLHVPDQIWPILAVKCNEAMIQKLSGNFQQLLETLETADAVLIGPGLGRQQDRQIRRLISGLEKPLVLDADGINAAAGHTYIWRARQGRVTVLTPHEGEFSRLLGGAPVKDRATQAAQFARMQGCILVLKGQHTLIALPDGTMFQNPTGNPGMAKGGSGDVLAGMIVSLLGQGLPPERAVPAAVFLHGHAGDLCAAQLGEYGMTPTDMLERIPLALQF